MTLTIDRLVTRCEAPRRYQGVARLLDDIARNRFASDLEHHLGPSLNGQPGVVSIKRLRIKIRISAARLAEEELLRTWLMEFGKALFTALAYPTGAGPNEIHRWSGHAEYAAALIVDLLTGAAGDHWYHSRARDIIGLGKQEAVVAVLLDDPAVIPDVLTEVERLGALDRLLRVLDTLALERLFRALGESMPEPGDLSIPDLIAVAKLAERRGSLAGFALDSRQQALRLFLEARKAGTPSTPRFIFHALIALVRLLELPDVAVLAEPGFQFAAQAGRLLPDPPLRVLQRVARLAALRPPRDTDSALLVRLQTAIADLRAVSGIAAAPAQAASAVCLESNYASLLLLLPVVQRLAWSQQFHHLGSGAWTSILAGVGLMITGGFDQELRRLDPAIALLAGILGEPDLRAIRASFKDLAETGIDLRILADQAVRTFGNLIRGFRKATPQAIVRQFLHTPGRIAVEPRRLLVHISPNPFHVALHASGMDTPIESVSWIDSRRVEFLLEGL